MVRRKNQKEAEFSGMFEAQYLTFVESVIKAQRK